MGGLSVCRVVTNVNMLLCGVCACCLIGGLSVSRVVTNVNMLLCGGCADGWLIFLHGGD